jgi:hypothetical protein
MEEQNTMLHVLEKKTSKKSKNIIPKTIPDKKKQAENFSEQEKTEANNVKYMI